MLPEVPRAGQDLVFGSGEDIGKAGRFHRLPQRRRHLLPGQFGERGFVVQRIDMRGPAHHVEEDDVLSFRRERGEPGRMRIHRVQQNRGWMPRHGVSGEQTLQGDAAESAAHLLQKPPALEKA